MARWKPALAVAVLAAAGWQLAELSGGPSGEPASKPATKLIQVDKAKRQVIVEGNFSLESGLLEFLLCREGTKDYESLLTTKAAPSLLHAAMLAIGLTPGKPVHTVSVPGKEPVLVPPQGAPLEVSLRWTDAKGVAQDRPAHALMVGAAKKQPVQALRWVFVGSDLLDDGRYWADTEGLFISVSNFPGTVIDVPFESTDKNALLEFAVNADAVPPKGTPVQIVITAVKGAETAPVARASFVVDAFGRLELDGQPIAIEDVPEAIKKFLARHAQGAADVRLDPRALIYDQERLRDALQEAGMADISFRRMSVNDAVLPRTPAELAKVLAWWKDQFARADELIDDPADSAGEALKSIRRQQKDFQATAQLWADYAARLSAMADAHRAGQKKEGTTKEAGAPPTSGPAVLP